MSTREEFNMLSALAAMGDKTAAESLSETGKNLLRESRCAHSFVEFAEMGQYARLRICTLCGLRETEV